MAQATTDNAAKAEQKFFELLKQFDHAVLVTHSARTSSLHGRPMAVAETSEDGSIWFITGADTAKVDELEKDAHLIAVMQKDRQFLSVSGRGELHRDKARIHKVWKEAYRAWFSSKDDPNIVLIRLNPTDAEYWDNKGLSSSLKFALRFAAAYISGKPMHDPNDVKVHAKVPLS
jgi:general stress protein 26